MRGTKMTEQTDMRTLLDTVLNNPASGIFQSELTQVESILTGVNDKLQSFVPLRELELEFKDELESEPKAKGGKK